MSTIAYQRGIKERIRRLVNTAGGQTAFARKIWGDPLPHKGKVGKWYNGRSAIRPEEAITVAKAFGVRPAWLLLGELPERDDVTRTEAKLAVDVASYIAREVRRAIQGDRHENESWFSDVADWRYDGEAALRLAVDREVRHLRDAFRDWDTFEQAVREGIDGVFPLNAAEGLRVVGATKAKQRALDLWWERSAMSARYLAVYQALSSEARRRLGAPGSALVHEVSEDTGATVMKPPRREQL